MSLKRRELIEEMIKTAAESTYPVVLVNCHDVIFYANPQFEKFIGLPADKIVRRDYGELVEEPDLQTLRNRLSKNSKDVLVTARCKGTTKKVLASTTLHYANGVRNKFLHVCTYCELREYDKEAERRKLEKQIEGIKTELDSSLAKTGRDIQRLGSAEAIRKTTDDLSSAVTKVITDLTKLLTP